jgi:hypothetical protein
MHPPHAQTSLSSTTHDTGKTPPTRNSEQRISPATLEGQPPAAILARLQQKCEGQNRPRLSDLHALLEAARASARGGASTGGQGEVLVQGLELFVKKNVEFREETAALFLRAMCRAGKTGFWFVCFVFCFWEGGVEAKRDLHMPTVSTTT